MASLNFRFDLTSESEPSDPTSGAARARALPIYRALRFSEVFTGLYLRRIPIRVRVGAI